MGHAMTTTAERPEYMLGDSQAERRRLVAQAALMEDEAGWLLQRLDIPAGGRAVDIGCGPVGILPQLSARVGPAGEVVGSTATSTCSTTPPATVPSSPTSASSSATLSATGLPRR